MHKYLSRLKKESQISFLQARQKIFAYVYIIALSTYFRSLIPLFDLIGFYDKDYDPTPFQSAINKM